MSKNYKKKNEKKTYKISKWLYVLMFLIPIVFITFFTSHLDNDIWYLLAEGRYIVNHGIYHIDPLSIHTGLEVTVQNWLSASIFYLAYKIGKEMGILILILLMDFLICLLTYKISSLISDNKILSLVSMLGTILFLSLAYITSRPQIFSFALLLGVIYVLELYVKTGKKKYLRWLPILSIIEANMHGSLWFMIFLFALPYIIDGIKIDALRTQGYNIKPLLFYLGIAFVAGLINPYGYKMMTFIFTSFTDKTMHLYIKELLPFNFQWRTSKMVFSLMIAIFCCYIFFREGKVRVRYICLFCGTLILGFISVKALSHFILVSIFPLTYFFKDMFPEDFSDLPESFLKTLNIVYKFGVFSFIAFLIGSLVIDYKVIKLKTPAYDSIMYIKDNYDTKDAKVYSSFNLGGTLEFYELKPYIDPRAEVFLKINNKKEDIFLEYYNLQIKGASIDEFLEKYNFTHLILEDGDILNGELEKRNYTLAYNDNKNIISVYVRNDLYHE